MAARTARTGRYATGVTTEPRPLDVSEAERSPTSAAVIAALEALAAGEMVVVVDDTDEHGGSLAMAAQFVTPAAIAFMTRTGGGRAALALTAERCDELGLGPMAREGESVTTPFTVTIDARAGIASGVSARDQAHTMQVAVDPASGPGDIVVGGHVQPIRTQRGGVLERADHAHAAVDLALLAGLRAASVISPLHDEHGALASRADLELFCAHRGLTAVTIADVIVSRWHRLPMVRREVETRMPTRFGDFTAIGYRSSIDGGHHVALTSGAIGDRDDVLVSVHSECFTGDVLHSLRCDCREQLEAALRMIAAQGGALVYVTHDDRAHDLAGDADPWGASRARRESGVATQILMDLGPSSIRLLTGARERQPRLDGLRVTTRIPLVTAAAAGIARLQTGRYA